MIFKCIVVLIALVATGAARTTSTSLNEIPHDEPRSAEGSSSYLSDLRNAYKIYEQCSATDLSPCLKLKLVSAMDRAFRMFSDVSIIDGVKFVKEPETAPEDNPKTEAEVEASLPRSLSEKEDALNGIITEKVATFFDTHSLQVKFPTASEIQRSLGADEGRKKKGKMAGLLLIPLLLGGTLIPVVLGGLALLAGKALIIAKIALILSGIIALKKLLGGGHDGGHYSGHEVVVDAHGGGPGWGRSYDPEPAQSLAYNAYAPKTTR